KAAIAYAWAKPVVLVAPAGDAGAGPAPVNYPAAYHGVIAVGAFDQHFVKAPFTSHQPYVTVTAAGAGVTVANPPSVSATDPSKAYTQLNSTSAASGIVTGIAPLIQAQFPDLTPAHVTRALTTSTRLRQHGGRGDGSGFGAVDANKALTAAAVIAETVPKTAASGAAQAPPSSQAVHSSAIHRNVNQKLIMDAIIAGVVFLLLLGSIFAIRAWRRRHARSARLPEGRAATQVPARKPSTAKKAPAKKGTAEKGTGKRGAAKKGRAPTAAGLGAAAGLGDPPAAEAAPELESAGFVPAPVGQAIPGSGSPSVAGPASPGFTGSSGFTGSAASGFTGSAASGFTGSAASGFTGSGGLTRSSSGFTGSALSGFAGSASSGFPASASSGPAPHA